MISSSPRGLGTHGAGAGRGAAVEDVDAGDGEVRLRLRRLLLDREHPALAVEGDDAVAVGVGDLVAEDRAALGPLAGALQEHRQVVAEEDVVAEHHGRGGAVEEVLGEDVGLREPLGLRLRDVLEAHPPLAAVPEQPPELVLVLGRGDDDDLAQAGEHQHRQRIVDHRLVVERQQLLRQRVGDRVEPGAGAAGEDDAPAVRSRLHLREFLDHRVERRPPVGLARCRRRPRSCVQSSTE